jgi:hypothetical protein
VFTAFGWSDEDLVRLVESVNIDSGEPLFNDPSLIAGYDMRSTVEPWLIVQGLPVEQVYYASTDDPYNGFGINVSPIDPVGDRGGPAIDRQTALSFMLDHETPFEVDGHSAVAGAWIDQGGYSLASWIAGDHIVTVTGKLPVPQLIAVARTVHQVEAGEWAGMRFQVVHNPRRRTPTTRTSLSRSWCRSPSAPTAKVGNGRSRCRSPCPARRGRSTGRGV